MSKGKEKCPKCKSDNTMDNGQGVLHCWRCDHSWRGKNYGKSRRKDGGNLYKRNG